MVLISYGNINRRGSRGGRVGGGARPPPFHRQNIGKKINFWIKYAPNCRKMHLKFQKFLGGMPSDPPRGPPPQGRTPAMSALPVYHPHPTPPLSKILDPRLINVGLNPPRRPILGEIIIFIARGVTSPHKNRPVPKEVKSF